MTAAGDKPDQVRLCGFLEQREAWLMERIHHYAALQDYTKYTSTLTEAWRASIQGLTESVTRAAKVHELAPELTPDEAYSEDPISAFGVLEAQRHRARGITLAMFLGLFKYYRQAYQDCLDEFELAEGQDREPYRLYLRRVFDRVEISYCQEWSDVGGGDKIAELQTANRQATNEKSKYLTLFESLPEPVMLLDDDLKLENANHAAQALLGLPHGTEGEAYYGKQAALDKLPGLAQEVGAFRDGQKRRHTFDMSVMRSGASRHFDVTLTRMLDYSGKFTGVVVHLQDMTSDREARLELEGSERRYRALFDDASDALMLLTPDEGFYACNPASLRLYGCGSEAEFQQLTPGILSPPFQPGGQESSDLAREMMNIALREGSHDFEWTHLRQDGSTFEASVRLTRISEQGQDALLATVRDISQRKALEHQVAVMVKQLQASNEDLEQFAYVASHDLTEPLRVIASFLELLQQRYADTLDDKANQYIDFAVDGAGRMKQLLDGLLKLSRVGTRGKEMRPLDADVALDRAMSNLSSTVQEQGAEVTREPLPRVEGDETQLTQLFQNLVGNAIKFQPPGGSARVHVASRRDGDLVEFSVSDNGIGVPPEHAGKIFELFKRLHVRKKYDGSGIGLSICKKIVERHGGAIWLESTPGEGTVFRFTLPGEPESGTPAAPDA